MSRADPLGEASSAETACAIEATHVHVTYADGTEAVRGVNLSVEQGEFFGFLGPNGAGKTTTIKTLTSLLHPTAGSVTVNGFDVVEQPEGVRQSVGYMAQKTSVDVELTARENLRFACRTHGVRSEDRAGRIDQLLDLVGLTDVADQPAGTFSGGMQKRLDAATALVHRPPIVFLDEPTTGLDPEARMRLWNHFQRINEQGTTVFLTTQYLEEVDRLCDRLAVIQDGKITTTGTPTTLKSAVGGDALDLTIGNRSAFQRDRLARIVEEIESFECPTIDVTDESVTITDENARQAIMPLFVALQDAGVRVTSFEIRSPTLDDVFLELTGTATDDSGDDTTALDEVAK